MNLEDFCSRTRVAVGMLASQQLDQELSELVQALNKPQGPTLRERGLLQVDLCLYLWRHGPPYLAVKTRRTGTKLQIERLLKIRVPLLMTEFVWERATGKATSNIHCTRFASSLAFFWGAK